LVPSKKLQKVYFVELSVAFILFYLLPALVMLFLGEYGWLVVFSVIIVPAFIVVAAYMPQHLKSVKFHLGENHLRKSEGVFVEHEVIVPYEKISTLHTFQGILDRRYSIGEVRIHTLGSEEVPHEVSIKGIENIEEVKGELIERMKQREGLKSKTKKSSEAILEDIYEELIDIRGELAKG
jgi:membrane protein YdbS with pleckstrin-like domain